MTKFLKISRYISMVGVLSLLLASFIAFIWGAVKTIDTVITVVSSYGQDPYISVSLIQLMDTFLIATGLFVFAVSLYELFIGKLGLPGWMLAEDLPELKEKLGGVIILVMVVKFLEHLVEWTNALETLLFAAGVAIVSAALIALSYLSKNSKSEK